jgi:hypothetical protein
MIFNGFMAAFALYAIARPTSFTAYIIVCIFFGHFAAKLYDDVSCSFRNRKK